jgi:dolichol-phosphate mannosyltransferase
MLQINKELAPNAALDLDIPVHNVYEFFPKTKDYCLCIPILNEGEKFIKQLKLMQLEQTYKHVDIVILDGGSSDGSTNIDYLADNHIRALLIRSGHGRLGTDLRMGFAYVLQQNYKGVITMDGNNKDHPQAVPDFIRALEAGFDFIQGSRFLPGGERINTPLSRLFAIRMIHAPLISIASGFRYTDTTNGFRGYSKSLLESSEIKIFRNVFTSYEILFYLSIRAARLKFSVTEIPVTRSYPNNGQIPTKISPVRGNVKVLVELLKSITGYYNP